MSAAIPAQRKLKDHVEAEINRYGRGKNHTTPDAEADIKVLQQSYTLARLHSSHGRTLRACDKSKDHLKLGSAPSKLNSTIERWYSKRAGQRSTEQNYEGDSTPGSSQVHAVQAEGDGDIQML